jgi:hypothetical protein
MYGLGCRGDEADARVGFAVGGCHGMALFGFGTWWADSTLDETADRGLLLNVKKMVLPGPGFRICHKRVNTYLV